MPRGLEMQYLLLFIALKVAFNSKEFLFDMYINIAKTTPHAAFNKKHFCFVKSYVDQISCQ